MSFHSSIWQVAIQYHEQIGAVKIVEMFESFGSNEGRELEVLSVMIYFHKCTSMHKHTAVLLQDMR